MGAESRGGKRRRKGQERGEAKRQINGWEWEGGEEAGAQGGRGTECVVEGERSSPRCTPPHPAQQMFTSGVQKLGLQEWRTVAPKWGPRPSRCRDDELYTLTPSSQLDTLTPHTGEVPFSLCLLSRLACQPSPFTQGWPNPPPPPSFPLPKGKSATSPSCQCPSAMPGQRQQARSCQLGWGGGWNKDRAFLLPNPK